MTSVKDERGFNQIFVSTPAAKIRKERRCDYMIEKMKNGNLNPQTTILEIGCGTGEGLHYIAEKTGAMCFGIDLSQKFIDEANQHYKNTNVFFQVADFNKPSTLQGEIALLKFDYIIGNGILHHLYYNLDESLTNMHELLTANGRLIFIEPNLYNPYIGLIFNIPYLRKKTFLEPDEMAFGPRFIKAKLKKARFSSYTTEIKDFLLPNIPEKLIQPVIKIGRVLEKTPFTYFAQSIFITATK